MEKDGPDEAESVLVFEEEVFSVAPVFVVFNLLAPDLAEIGVHDFLHTDVFVCEVDSDIFVIIVELRFDSLELFPGRFEIVSECSSFPENSVE